MPVITVYQHGQSSGTPPMRNDHPRAKRDDVMGWSDKTARSNTRFLQSVVLDGLTGHGYAFTLTLRDCPPEHSDWHRSVKAFIMRLQRMGMVRLHWVTEWQRRGVPHLHGVVYFPEASPNESPSEEMRLGMSYPERVISHWCQVAQIYTCAPWAQHINPITDSLGWLQYLAKHASRGAKHYQRSSESIPPGWKKTGRMWGKWGAWDVAEPSRFYLTRQGGWAYRRLVRSYRVAASRCDHNGFAIRASRRMLKCNLRSLSEVRGTSGWVPESVTMQLLKFLHDQGFPVDQ
jgi:hypothetical protein